MFYKNIREQLHVITRTKVSGFLPPLSILLYIKWHVLKLLQPSFKTVDMLQLIRKCFGGERATMEISICDCDAISILNLRKDRKNFEVSSFEDWIWKKKRKKSGCTHRTVLFPIIPANIKHENGGERPWRTDVVWGWVVWQFKWGLNNWHTLLPFKMEQQAART